MSDAFRWQTEPWGSALRCTALEAIAPHLFTSRELPLGGHESDAGWAALAASFRADRGALVRVRQVHGADVLVRARAADGQAEPAGRPGGPLPAADLIVSDDPSLVLAVQTADCVPLLLADPVSHSVAAVHAGCRGTAARAAGAAVRTLADRFGAKPADLVAAIGPSIGPCCYEVGPELREAFLASAHERARVDSWFQEAAGDRLRLDLWRANRDQLVQAGLRPDAVHTAALCTAHHPDRFCSYRRDGAGAGRMAAAIRSAG